jgi:hypothetical protein
MADESPQRRQSDAPNGRQLTRAERSLVRRLSSALRFADLMALLMVAATAFSALATWRTAQLMHSIFMVSERPYLGVEHVGFDSIDSTSARIVIDCRNFGHVSASDGVSQIRLMLDGRPVKGADLRDSIRNLGIVSPNVPHVYYRFIPIAIYRQLRAGQGTLVADVLMNYHGPDQRQFCYNEIMTYDSRTDSFSASGGGDRCNGQIF